MYVKIVHIRFFFHKKQLLYLNINKNKLKDSCVQRNGSGVHRNFVEIAVTSITITVGGRIISNGSSSSIGNHSPCPSAL